MTITAKATWHSPIDRQTMRVDRLVLLAAVIVSASALEWLSLHNAKYQWNKQSDCDRAAKTGSLHRVQRKFCKNNLQFMKAVVKAAKDTIAACQEVFHKYRWNCSSLTATKLTPDLTAGTREQAFVYALASSGLIRSMAKACRSGDVPKCGCGDLPTDDSYWAGCSDNVEFGSKFERAFLEKPLKKNVAKDKVAYVNSHNYRLGRRLMSSRLRRECECRGLLNDCNEAKLCWESLPPLEEIGESLRQKYTEAIEVEETIVGRKIKLKPVSSKIPSVKAADMIYVAKSPDYCVVDEKLGSVGTYGRSCNASATDSTGCDSMCCGRAYVISKRAVVERCNCKMSGCCEVKCDECWKNVEYYNCL